jgi:hypothetical protein
MGFNYYDATIRALKAAIYHYYYGDYGWNIAVVKTPDTPEKSFGLYSSFKFDSTGNAAIASSVYDSVLNLNTSFFAYQVPSGGDCGAGLWKCEGLHFLGGDAKYDSLDFNYQDTP